MSSASADLRRQAQDARLASAAATAAASAADPLAGYLPKLADAIEQTIGGTASGADRSMFELLQRAGRDQRAAAEQCRAAARTAERMADRLDAEAQAEEDREAAERDRERRR